MHAPFEDPAKASNWNSRLYSIIAWVVWASENGRLKSRNLVNEIRWQFAKWNVWYVQKKRQKLKLALRKWGNVIFSIAIMTK